MPKYQISINFKQTISALDEIDAMERFFEEIEMLDGPTAWIEQNLNIEKKG